MKNIIINADDFGYSKVFNEEILSLAEDKMITGISVMVDYLNDEQIMQIEKVKKYSNILGLHVDFENINLKKINFDAEVERQVKRFMEILDCAPVFLDMHKYSHRKDGQKAIEEFCLKNNVYFRNLDGSTSCLTTSKKKITGSFLVFEEIKSKLEMLSINSSTTILFHPGRFDPNSNSTFNQGRENDVKNIMLLNDFILRNSEEFQKIGYREL